MKMWDLIKQWLAKKACYHDWEVHSTKEVYDDFLLFRSDYPAYINQTLICKKCGKIKRIKL